MSIFDKRKAAILAELQSQDPDLSPKGKPDDEVVDLLALLNSHADFVTTSSCSGRAVVFLDADGAICTENARGRWLMSSHTALLERIGGPNVDQLFALFFDDIPVACGDWSSSEKPERLVTLKFEPLVSGISCTIVNFRFFTSSAGV